MATSALLCSLKHIAQCQEGIGGSFPTLGQGVAGCTGPMRCQAGEPGGEPGTCSPTLCPNHLKGKWSRNAPKRVRFGPVIAVINPFPPPQPLPGARQLGAGGNEAPGCSRAGAACLAPCPQTPSRPAWWRQQFARRPGTPCMAEMAFVLGCRMAGAASCRCCAASRCRLGISLPSRVAAFGRSTELRGLGESRGS